MKKRKQYISGEVSHVEYYGQFVTAGTIAYVMQMIGRDAIINSRDPHFNDIPLANWDRIVARAPGSGKFADAGDYYTKAGGVCMLKEAARQIKAAAHTSGEV